MKQSFKYLEPKLNDSQKRVKNYILSLENLVTEFEHYETKILRIKKQALNEEDLSKRNVERLLQIVEDQKHRLDILIRHLQSYKRLKEYIEKNLAKNLNDIIEQRNIINNLSFEKILNDQGIHHIKILLKTQGEKVLIEELELAIRNKDNYSAELIKRKIENKFKKTKHRMLVFLNNEIKNMNDNAKKLLILLDNFFQYILNHSKKIDNNLNSQYKELKYMIKKKEAFGKENILTKSYRKIRSKLKYDLVNFIKKEDNMFSVFLELTNKNIKEIEEFRKEIEKIELYEDLKEKFIKLGLFWNLMPIHGIGDAIASIFWTSTLVITILELKMKEQVKLYKKLVSMESKDLPYLEFETIEI